MGADEQALAQASLDARSITIPPEMARGGAGSTPSVPTGPVTQGSGPAWDPKSPTGPASSTPLPGAPWLYNTPPQATPHTVNVYSADGSGRVVGTTVVTDPNINAVDDAGNTANFAGVWTNNAPQGGGGDGGGGDGGGGGGGPSFPSAPQIGSPNPRFADALQQFMTLLSQFAGGITGIVSPFESELFKQATAVLGGGAAARGEEGLTAPFVASARQSAKGATAKSLQETENQLNAVGLGGTGFGQGILANTRQAGGAAEAALPLLASRELLSLAGGQAPPLIGAAESALGAGAGAAASGLASDVSAFGIKTAADVNVFGIQTDAATRTFLGELQAAVGLELGQLDATTRLQLGALGSLTELEKTQMLVQAQHQADEAKFLGGAGASIGSIIAAYVGSAGGSAAISKLFGSGSSATTTDAASSS